MDWELRRLLEHAGILRRGTPTRLLLEEEDDDPFADDDADDSPFGDDDDSGDGGGGDSGAETERVPPEELDAEDIKKYGSPRFLDIETELTNMFNNSVTSAAAAAQALEVYPGEAMEEAEPTPAKDDEPEEDDKDDKNESYYRYGNSRDKWLIQEASRLLTEADEEGAAADEFDMERFCTELANYMENIHNTMDVEAGIFNSARQMVLNNFGPETEKEFVDMLAAVGGDKYSFIQTGFEGAPEAPPAIGTGAAAGGA